MKIQSILLLGACLLLTSVPLSHQYGTIFADTVLPVKGADVKFPDVTSDHISSGGFNVGSMSLSDPGGFNINVPHPIDIKSMDDIELVGELGFQIGSDRTPLVNFTTGGDLSVQSEDFFAMFSRINFNMNHPNDFDTSVTFDSSRYMDIFANDFIDFNGVIQLAIQSVNGNLDAFAPNIFGSGSSVPISADDTVIFSSRTGFIDWTAEDGIFAYADLIDLISVQNTEMVADKNMYVHAEDVVEITSGRNIISALGDVEFSSERNVDFTSPSGFFINAQTSINLSAGNEFHLLSTEEAISQVTAVAQNRISIIASQNGVIGSRDLTWEIFRAQSVIANAMVMDSTSATIIGNEETASVTFNAGNNALSFFLDNAMGVGDEIDFIARSVDFNVANDLSFSSREFRASSGSSFLTVDAVTSVSADDTISIEATAEHGYITATSTGGQTFSAGDDIRTDAHETTFIAGNSITSNSQEDIDLVFNSRVLAAGDTFTMTSDDSTIKGGTILVLTDGDIVLEGIAGINPEVVLESGDDMRVHSTGDYNLNSSEDFEILTNNDFLLSSLDDITFTAVEAVVIVVDDDGFFTSHTGDFTVTAGDDILFRNSALPPAPEESIISLAFGTDIFVNAASAIGSQTTVDTLFDAGHDITATASGDTFLGASNLEIVTLSDRAFSGISFDASGSTITSVSGFDTTFSGYNVNFFSETYEFTTPLITLTGSEGVNLIGSSIEFDTVAFDVESNGHIVFDAVDSISVNSETLLGFTAKDSINITSSNEYESRSLDLEISVGSFEFLTGLLNMLFLGDLTVDATQTAGSTISFSTADDISFNADGTLVVDTGDFLFKTSSDLSVTSGNDLLISSDDIKFSGHSMSTNTVDFSITATDISFSSDEFGAFWEQATMGDMIYRATDAVYLTSDGNMLFNHIAGPLSVDASNELLFVGDDSLSYEAQSSTLTISNRNGDAPVDTIEIQSGGRTGLFSDISDVTLRSSSSIDVEAGRIIMDAKVLTSPIGAVFSTSLGRIETNSAWGSIHYSSDENVLLQATNEDATASHFLTSTEGVHMRAAQGGLYFNVEGFLSADTKVAVSFLSTGNNGDIYFDSELSGINLFVDDDITYTAAKNISLVSAFGAEFTPEIFMSFFAPKGQLDVNAQRGITINAGAGFDNADIVFTQSEGAFNVSVADQIILHSLGDVDEESILVSGKSDIRFNTANTGDISFFANDLLSFEATGTFTASSLNNMRTESVAGSISIDAVTGADFVTEGGPIYFRTFSTNPGAEITMTAETENVEFISGNSTYVTAIQQGTFVASTGISITSEDGSLDVLAATADSFINLISQGGMLVSSTGNDLTPDEGIVMDSANNIEFGTVDTSTIAFNTVDDFIVGSYSRPIVTFNAAGSDSQKGMTITSSGGIVTSTEAELIVDVDADLLVDVQLGITSLSYGPTTFTTIGTKGIFLNSNDGILRVTGEDQMSLTSNTQVVASSGGSVQFIASGKGAVDQIRFTAPEVEILSGNHQMLLGVLDADLSESFTLTVGGDGIFDASLDEGPLTNNNLDREGNSIYFDAQDSFDAATDGDMLIATSNVNGIILFETQETTSNIILQTDTQSDIEFIAGGELGFFADSTAASAPEITFSAIHDDPNDDARDGDIEIGAENNVVVSSVEDFDVSAGEDILFETTGSVDDVGSPLTMTATSEIEVTSTDDMVIRNVAQQKAELSFSALSDVIIQNSNTAGWISFDADGVLTQQSTRDNEVVTSSYEAEIEESFVVTANGKDTNDDFGVRIDVQQGSLSFKSLFGSVRFSSEDNTGSFTTTGSMSLSTDRDAVLQGESTSISANVVEFQATRGAVDFFADDGMEFAANQLQFTTNGINNNGDHSMLFEATGGSTPYQMNAGTDFIQTCRGSFYDAKLISLEATTGIQMTTNDGDFELEADALVSIFANTLLQVNSGRHMNLEASTIAINAEATISYEARTGDLVLETTGSDAAIDMFSSGKFEFSAVTGFNAHTSRTPTSDLRIIGALSRIEFNPDTVNDDGFSLDFVADHGDLTIDAQGDDADIYVESATIFVEASNDVVIDNFDAVPGASSTIDNTGAVNVNVGGTIYMQAGGILTLNADPGGLLLSSTRESGADGGTMVLSSGGTMAATAVNTMSFHSLQEGGNIYISSVGDTSFSGLVEISAGTIKIPMALDETNPGFADNKPCETGQFFWTDANQYLVNPPAYNNNLIGYLCFCQNQNSLRGVPFYEPPCIIGVDPFCTGPLDY